MKFFYIILSLIPICFLFTTKEASAQKQTIVYSISFEGNDFFSTRELYEAMVLKKDKVFSSTQLDLDLKSIRERYRQYGYLLIKIQEPQVTYDEDSSYADISIKISEGRQVIIGEINISGNSLITGKELYDLIQTKAGKPLNEGTLNNDIVDILDLYEKKGMPFTRVEIKDITLYDTENSPKIKIDLRIKEEEKIKIENIKISGNETTKDYVITREIKLDRDKQITKQSLEDTKRRLEALNIFESVTEPKVYFSKQSKTAGLIIEVIEGNTNTFDGILGYVPPPVEGEKGYLTGLVDLSFRNLFGTGRKLNAKWQQQVKGTQELEFKYNEPYIFSLPLSIDAGFQQRIQDTTYTKRRVDLKGDLIINDNITVSAIGGYERVIPSDDSLRTFVIADSRTLYSGLELKYDSRDNIYIPNSGIVYKTAYIYGSKKVFNESKVNKDLQNSKDESFTIQRMLMELELYFSTFKRQSNLLRFFGGNIISNKIEDADLFRIGGLKYVRGYRAEQFLASRLISANIEPRFSFGRKSFIFAFFDMGYYYREADNENSIPKQESFIFGYGAGMRFETKIGIIGVSYALGKGDSFLDGKINFGYINEF